MTWPVLNYPAELMIKTGIKVDDALLSLKSEEEFMDMMKNGNWFDQLKSNISGFFFATSICSL